MDDTGKLIAVIGDEDTVTGFVLAGVGQKSVDGCNFLVVKSGECPALLRSASASSPYFSYAAINNSSLLFSLCCRHTLGSSGVHVSRADEPL